MSQTEIKRSALYLVGRFEPSRMRCVAIAIAFVTVIAGGSDLSSGSPSIEVWHGDLQRVGHLGDAQDDFNLMGRVQPWREVDGRNISKTVTVVKESGSRPLPARIRWKEVGNPQDVGQYVDGLWRLEGGGLRTGQIGYDRVFLIGERNWRDYDVRTSITLHAVASETTPVSGGAGVGVILRFAGHVTGGPRHFPSGQPKWGFQPFGALGFLRWKKGDAQSQPQMQFYPGGSNQAKNFGEFPTRPGETYGLRFRCETLRDDAEGRGVTRYSFKIWKSANAEPEAWSWQEAQTSAVALRRASRHDGEAHPLQRPRLARSAGVDHDARRARAAMLHVAG